jgi:hypothetical protein
MDFLLKCFLTTITLIVLYSCSESQKGTVATYNIGFNTVRTIDKSRLYKPNTDTTDKLHFRPLDIDIWYPAINYSQDSILLFRNILGLLEKRAIYYTGSQEWKGVTAQVAKSFCEGFKCSDTSLLLNFKTKSFKSAEPAKLKFPLIIYLCAYNGMSFENYNLFEKMVEKGFVVACISSIGRYPGDMTMKKEDLLEQVNDAISSLNVIRQNPNIDSSKIAIVGYSWGGLAGAILAGKIANVSCLISLDGSEFHHYGESTDEDADFTDLLNSPDFKNIHLSVPYLRLESPSIIHQDKKDSIYNFSRKIIGQRTILQVDSAVHEDFSCLSELVRESGNCKTNKHFRTVSEVTISFLEAHLRNKNSFMQTLNQELNKTIHVKL